MTTAEPVGPLDGSVAAEPVPSGLGDLMTGIAALGDAQGDYAQAHAYYSGNTPEVFASARLRWAMVRTGINFRLNFARTPVDAVTERLRISAVSSPDPGAEAALQDLWDANKLGLQMRQVLKKASEFGDAYVVVWPNAEGQVGVFYNSPQCMRVIYEDDNPLAKRYAIKWWAEGKAQRVDLYYPDRIAKWVTRPGAKGKDATDWMPYVDTVEVDPQTGEPVTVWPLENPFGEVPVFHFRNDLPYGCPEHAGFYGAQDAIHKLAMSHMAGVDYQAFPQRYALSDGSGSGDAATEDEDLFAFADETTGATTPPQGEARANLSADAGSVWWMQGVKEMGQFDPADHSNFTEPMLVYLRAGAEITNTPLHRVDPTGDQPSGQSLRASEAPFVAKIEDRQLHYGAEAEEMFRFALRLAGFADPEVQVHWDPAQSQDDVDGWTAAKAKLDAGVPYRQVMLEMGYAEDVVSQWEAEKEARKAAMPVAMVPPAPQTPAEGVNEGDPTQTSPATS
jgi:hypothetical protein